MTHHSTKIPIIPLLLLPLLTTFTFTTATQPNPNQPQLIQQVTFEDDATAALCGGRSDSPATCPVNCFRPDPVCGVDGVTYWCGCSDAACHGARVAKLGPCEVGNGGSASIPRQALLLVHIVWLFLCSKRWKPVMAMVVVNFAFAIVNILFKMIVDVGTNHMVIVTYRFAASAVFLAPIAWYWERKSAAKLTASILCYMFFGALIGITATQYLFLLGLEYTSATLSCTFLNMVPVNTFILSLMFRLEKANLKCKAGRAKVLGVLICLGGIMLLILYKGIPLTNTNHEMATENESTRHGGTSSDQKTHKWVLGSVLLLAACFSWSSWFIVQARIGNRYPCQYSSTAILSLFAAIQCAIVAAILDRNIAVWVLKGKLEIITVLYSGIVGSGLCYAGLCWCVKQRGPVFTAAFTPFTQIFVAFFDYFILHEQLFLGSVIGSLLVILGLYVLLLGESRETEDHVVLKQVRLTKDVENIDAESQVSLTIHSRSP